MAYTKQTWVNDQTELSAENFNHLEDGVEKAYGQLLLAVDSVAPEECVEGDKYYNTETNKIYTATGTNTWGTTGVDAELGVFYIVLESQNIYTYDGEKLISVGGGAGGGDSTPIGTIQEYAGSTAPNGYLMCDGSAVSRTTYKDLFRVIGTTYGSGDGSTTFNLPNIKGKVVVMLDSNDTDFDTLGETGGEKTHTLTQNEMPSHAHNTFTGGPGTGAYSIQFTDVAAGSSSLSYILTEAAGGNQPHNIVQPYIVLNKIIKVTKTTPVQAQVVNTYSDSTEDTYSCDYVNDKTDLSYCVATLNNTQTVASFYLVDLNERARYSGNFTLSGNGIRIGAGIHTVRISASLFIDDWAGGTNYLWLQIYKNNSRVSGVITSGSSYYHGANVPYIIVPVQEGDIIKMYADAPSAQGTIRTGSDNTWLCVEKVD